MKKEKIKRVEFIVPINLQGTRIKVQQRQLNSKLCDLSFHGVSWIKAVYQGVTTMIPVQNVVQVILEDEEVNG